MSRCIYCNSADINESDIVPSSLTHKKLRRKFTCRFHNSYVGTHYEHEIASKTSVLRNLFDIRYRNGGATVDFPAIVIISDIEYKVEHFSSMNDLFWNSTELLGSDGKIKKFAIINQQTPNIPADKIQIKYPSINECIRILFSPTMEKLAAKVCYEYYCYKTRVDHFEKNRFEDIVKFITDKNIPNREIVSLVNDPVLDQMLKSEFGIGSTTVFFYTNIEGTTYGVFRLWDLVTYRVKLCTSCILRSSITIEGFWSSEYDGTMRNAKISKLSIFRGVDLSRDREKTVKETLKILKLLFEESLLTRNALRNTINKIKTILVAPRPLSDKIGYCFCFPDSKISRALWIILNIYDQRELWNKDQPFECNIRKIFGITDDKVVMSKNYFQQFNSMQLLDIEGRLNQAINFYETIASE